jgi:hypothetical protein
MLVTSSPNQELISNANDKVINLEGQPTPDLHPDNQRNESEKALMSSPTGSLPCTIRTAGS